MFKGLTLMLRLLIVSQKALEIASYSQVQISGSQSADSEGPRIFKSYNTDLMLPKVFNQSVTGAAADAMVWSEDDDNDSNSSTNATPNAWPNNYQREAMFPVFVTPSSRQNVTTVMEKTQTAKPTQTRPPLPNSLTDEQQYASTGRAVHSRPNHAFGQLLAPLVKTPTPLVYRQSKVPHISSHYSDPMIYQNSPSASTYYSPSRPQYGKLHGQGQLMDRFAPGEAVASQLFRNKHQQQRQHAAKVAAPLKLVQTYAPVRETYAYPPLNVKYPSPAKDSKINLSSGSVTSYLPPASGPVHDGGYKYAGPVANAGYQYNEPAKETTATDMEVQSNMNDMTDMTDMKTADNGDGNDGDGANDDVAVAGVLPASAMDMNAGDHDHDHNDGDVKDEDMKMGAGMMLDMQNMHDHDHEYDTNKEYPTPPPGWLEAHPESAQPKPNDHDHVAVSSPAHHDFYEHGHHGPYDYSDIIHHHKFPIFHHDFYHDDHHPHIHVATSTPEPPPPPEPALEGRVKKYSYFYIGRKLWYIPLYFTVWFSFYVLWLIIKSIARHKVDLPNHTVSRRRRSLLDYTEPQRNEYLNDLTVNVLAQIEQFKQKYWT